VSAKIIVTSQGVVALLGNGIALYLMMNSKSSCSNVPFVTSFVSSGIMMGIYLLIIAAKDLSAVRTFHVHIAQWTLSEICLGIAILNFVSTETSLSVLSVLSVFRFLERQWEAPTEKKTIMLATFCIWTVIVCLVATYLSQYSHGSVQVKNNLCLIIGVYNARTASSVEQFFHYVLLLVNGLLLFVMCVSAIKIVVKVSKHKRLGQSVVLRKRSSAETHVMKSEIRLLLPVLPNVLCWMPFLAVAVMQSTEGNISDSVQAWMAISVIPLWSSVNPFLCILCYLRGKVSKKQVG